MVRPCPDPGAATKTVTDDRRTVRLRLLETSDLHMFLRGWNYYQAEKDHGVGLAHIATLIHAARDEAPNCLLFDNGDTCQGSPVGDFMAGNGGGEGAHPMIRAMNLLGYDAATIGNHEFNYGLSFLREQLKDAVFPFVCSNVTLCNGAPLLPPSIVLDREVIDDRGQKCSLRIGVIGFVPPQIMVWDAIHLHEQIMVMDMVEAARQIVPELRKRCDVIVALCHCGISAEQRQGGEENAALYLAEIEGIDALLLGHTHHVFPGEHHDNLPGVDAVAGTLHDVPAVMPGFWGSHLGVIDLMLRQTERGWVCADFQVEARPVCRREEGRAHALVHEDPAILEEIQPEHEATMAWMEEPVGWTSVPLTSWFTFLGSDPCLALVNAAQLAFARPLLAGTEWEELPLLSAAAPFHAGAMATDAFVNIPVGELTIRDLVNIYPFANMLSVVRCSGAELREWLERSATVFNHILPEEDAPQPLLDPMPPVYTFDVIMGDAVSGALTCTVDISSPRRYCEQGRLVDSSAQRINDLCLDGRPVEDDQMFAVVTNNYRASGGGHFPGTGADRVIVTTHQHNRDLLVRYVRRQGCLLPPPAGNGWHFRPLPFAATVCMDLPAAASVAAGQRSDLTFMEPVEGGNRYRVGRPHFNM
ncbi:bifunctional 2',3'-cyclic-nucleotide 2'-phosphodiesterase/3'-nucleotidase [Acetobacter sicerae]|uniref:Bifunctional 2',3'-cyclic-nucleotide 2'-phosphodiesterase/3'-nucleotidase n=1 Tax=Acetobacter sicerae TaxID=85325 RepID=A0ABS8W1D4_9PROT|nr:bifunctional 2',3'-cyclic-nucleotide 2'-phosphodiesterase/3'-nucleotidase [Acetobacter sicerae]MCE0745384.1 bifunctional 2',3'-cyclic-nucleotide 2'-phosphodiesterase/3'-nucleotidase [Acetobacter sicerae]